MLFNHTRYELIHDKVFLIPPNTPFSTRFGAEKSSRYNDVLVGSRISGSDNLKIIQQQNKFDHFFIHFNLGLQYDNIKPNVYEYTLNENAGKQLLSLKESLIGEYEHIDFKQTATIQALLLSFVALISTKHLMYKSYDKRVIKVLSYIDRNFHLNISNKDFSEQIAMSPNSFLRLFKINTGQPLHNYLQKRRIEEAITLLHHTDKSIDQIATACGYCDRYHFSKAFKKQMNFSPAYYRKQLTMN